MNDPRDPDDHLTDELRRYFARVDPVPGPVTQFAEAALGWRRLDADLAELLSDSALETASLATVRGTVAAVRSVSFGADELTVELEIHAQGTHRTLLGMLTPASITAVEVQAADGATVARTESDALGRFRAELPSGGNFRLRLAPADPDCASPIETSWITI
jgi:hypothetical protein